MVNVVCHLDGSRINNETSFWEHQWGIFLITSTAVEDPPWIGIGGTCCQRPNYKNVERRCLRFLPACFSVLCWQVHLLSWRVVYTAAAILHRYSAQFFGPQGRLEPESLLESTRPSGLDWDSWTSVWWTGQLLILSLSTVTTAIAGWCTPLSHIACPFFSPSYNAVSVSTTTYPCYRSLFWDMRIWTLLWAPSELWPIPMTLPGISGGVWGLSVDGNRVRFYKIKVLQMVSGDSCMAVWMSVVSEPWFETVKMEVLLSL